MKKWFVIHDLLAYSQHPDMIGNVVKVSGSRSPESSSFAEIKKGDHIVYYATRDHVVVGVFRVVSNLEYLPNDKYWKEIMVYKIEPIEIPPSGNYLHLKKLLKDPKVNLDLFPNKEKWGVYLQGRTCVQLTEKDYLVMKDAMSKSEYFKAVGETTAEATQWHKKHAKKDYEPKEIEGTLHQKIIEKWKIEEEKKFGLFKPYIKTNTVDLNEILPQSIWLTENKKYVDAMAKLEIGSQPIYQSILEVQHKGSKEDLCVRVSVILPFVTRIDIVSDENVLPQIKELLERIADANIVKSRVRFYSFKDFMG